MNLLLQSIVRLDLATAIATVRSNKRKAAKTIFGMLKSGRFLCQQRFGAESDDRILVKEGWVTRGSQTVKVRYHARGKSGRSYNRKSNIHIVFRFIPPQEDEIFLRRLDTALEKFQVPKQKLNHVTRRGEKVLVNRIARDCRLTTKDFKEKVLFLVRNFPEYKPVPINRKSVLKSERW